MRSVQHFERYRLELDPENPVPYDVLLGRSGAERREQLGLVDAPAAPDRELPLLCRNRPQSVRRVPRLLAVARARVGDAGISERESLTLLGLPLSEATGC